MGTSDYQQGFGKIPKVIPNGGASKMTGCDAQVYIVLAQHRNDEKGYSWPRRKLIALEAGVTVRAVEKAVARLEAGGMIEVKRGGGRGNSNRYWLLEEKGEAACAFVDTETANTGAPFQAVKGERQSRKGRTPKSERANAGAVKGECACARTERTERTENNRDAAVELLTDRGVDLRAAETMAGQYTHERVEEVCHAADGQDLVNPGGWIRKALTDAYDVGDDVREALGKVRNAEDRKRAVECFRAKTPAGQSLIIEAIREGFPGPAQDMERDMKPDDLLAIPGFQGALLRVLQGENHEKLKEHA